MLRSSARDGNWGVSRKTCSIEMAPPQTANKRNNALNLDLCQVQAPSVRKPLHDQAVPSMGKDYKPNHLHPIKEGWASISIHGDVESAWVSDNKGTTPHQYLALHNARSTDVCIEAAHKLESALLSDRHNTYK